MLNALGRMLLVRAVAILPATLALLLTAAAPAPAGPAGPRLMLAQSDGQSPEKKPRAPQRGEEAKPPAKPQPSSLPPATVKPGVKPQAPPPAREAAPRPRMRAPEAMPAKKFGAQPIRTKESPESE